MDSVDPNIRVLELLAMTVAADLACLQRVLAPGTATIGDVQEVEWYDLYDSLVTDDIAA